ncbi:pseudouridine synthase, partial [Brucella oryzae]
QAHLPEAQMINRVDKDTSGLVLMSLNGKAHAAIASQFEARTTEKSYRVVVWGRVEGDEGLIDLPLAIDLHNKPRHRGDLDHGKPAQTLWQVSDRHENPTRLPRFPLTGGTHQLRGHMKALGHV